MPYNLSWPGMPLNLAKCLVMPYNLPVGGQYWCEVLRLILWSGHHGLLGASTYPPFYQRSAVVSSGLVSRTCNLAVAMKNSI
jgi:hypothetical protein